MPPVTDSVKQTLLIFSVCGNRIARVHSTYFEGFLKLTAVHFSDNELIQIPDLRPISSTLDYLLLTGNCLTEISPVLYEDKFPVLAYIRLDENQIKTIPTGVYSAWPAIRSIRIDVNNLTTFKLPKFLVINSTDNIRMEMGVNPWRCDSALSLLVEMDTGIMEVDRMWRQYPRLGPVWIMDYPYMDCTEPPWLVGKWLGELSKLTVLLRKW